MEILDVIILKTSEARRSVFTVFPGRHACDNYPNVIFTDCLWNRKEKKNGEREKWAEMKFGNGVIML